MGTCGGPFSHFVGGGAGAALQGWDAAAAFSFRGAKIWRLRWHRRGRHRRCGNPGAVCDGALPLFRNKDLVVIGGGDTAVEEATFLTKFASKVYLVHRRDELRASKIMQQRVLNHSKIEMVWDTVLADAIGEEVVTGARLKNVKTEKESEVGCAGIFYAIGHTPNTAFLNGQLETDETGYITVKPGRTYTSVEGVFACGDVADKIYRQAVTAAGTGCAAALDAERWLAGQGVE